MTIRIAQNSEKKDWTGFLQAAPMGLISLLSYKKPQRAKAPELSKQQLKQLQKQLKGK